MANINIRDLFPEYELDCFVDVPDGEEEAVASCITKEIADVYVEFQRAEVARERRMYRYKGQYSLDFGNGIENEALYFAPSPEELFMDKLSREELRAALAALPEKQSRRVQAHYFDGMSVTEIARAEGVAKSRVSESISRGLQNMKNILKNSF
jgi:RNA polymerase sigma-70 factor (ECF subfamily)